MKIQLPIITLLAWALLALTAPSCNNNNATSTNNNITVGVQGDGSGCTVVSYLDGGSAITFTGNGSNNYSNVSNGTHSVSIYAPLVGSSGCTFNLNNNTHTVGVNNPCGGGAFYVSCD